LVGQAFDQLLPPRLAFVAAIGGYFQHSTTLFEPFHELDKFRMIYGIAVYSTQIDHPMVKIHVQKLHGLLDVETVIFPMLGPLIDKPSTSTARTFERAYIGQFNVQSRYHFFTGGS
jgi:hypothetical protein